MGGSVLSVTAGRLAHGLELGSLLEVSMIRGMIRGPVSNGHHSNGQHSNGQLSNGQLSSGQLSSGQLRSLAPRAYRLIDALLQPHPQLDGLYDSIEEAIRDATGWLEGLGPEAATASIGLEVSTGSGGWRTIRLPELLLCPLPTAALSLAEGLISPIDQTD